MPTHTYMSFPAGSKGAEFDEERTMSVPWHIYIHVAEEDGALVPDDWTLEFRRSSNPLGEAEYVHVSVLEHQQYLLRQALSELKRLKVDVQALEHWLSQD